MHWVPAIPVLPVSTRIPPQRSHRKFSVIVATGLASFCLHVSPTCDLIPQRNQEEHQGGQTQKHSPVSEDGGRDSHCCSADHAVPSFLMLSHDPLPAAFLEEGTAFQCQNLSLEDPGSHMHGTSLSYTFHMCISVHLCVHNKYASACRGQKESDPLDLDIQAVASSLIWLPVNQLPVLSKSSKCF